MRVEVEGRGTEERSSPISRRPPSSPSSSVPPLVSPFPVSSLFTDFGRCPSSPHAMSDRISDLENGLLNLERQWERLLRQYSKKYPEPFKTLDPAVFGFSLFLYEMAVGAPLGNLSDLDKYPPNASKEVLNVPHTPLTPLALSPLRFCHASV